MAPRSSGTVNPNSGDVSLSNVTLNGDFGTGIEARMNLFSGSFAIDNLQAAGAQTGILINSTNGQSLPIDITNNVLGEVGGTRLQTGIHLELTGTQTTTVTGNQLLDYSQRGIYLWRNLGIVAQYNDFDSSSPSAWAIYCETLGDVDARYNWWGDPSGPTSPNNPGGSGDPVDNLVVFSPFLTAVVHAAAG